MQQVASIIAERRDKWLTSWNRFQDDCDLYDIEPCASFSAMNAFSVSLGAKTLALVLKSATENRPENRLYIGAIPDEVKSLYDRTLSDAQDVDSAAAAFSTCFPNCDSSSKVDLQMKGDELENALNAWAPYL